MSDAATKLLEQLLALPEADRAAVADVLDASLPPLDHWDDPEFVAEIERRMKHADEHPESLLDADQVFAEARARLQAKRAS